MSDATFIDPITQTLANCIEQLDGDYIIHDGKDVEAIDSMKVNQCRNDISEIIEKIATIHEKHAVEIDFATKELHIKIETLEVDLQFTKNELKSESARVDELTKLNDELQDRVDNETDWTVDRDRFEKAVDKYEELEKTFRDFKDHIRTLHYDYVRALRREEDIRTADFLYDLERILSEKEYRHEKFFDF